MLKKVPAGDDAQGATGPADAGPAEGGGELDLEAIGDELAAAEGEVETRIEGALTRYRGMYPPEVLAEFEDDLRCYLMTHPVASQLLARIRPRAQRVVSGEGAVLDPTQEGDLPAREDKAG